MGVAYLRPVCLRCEYGPNPLGVHALSPRLSWELESTIRAQHQTAYQVLVASSPALLKQDQADLWDSGKVASAQTTFISYAGQMLKSRQQCFWQVRVWDENGSQSAYSDFSMWEMGLLNADDWQGEWIGLRTLKSYPSASLAGCPWVWTPVSTEDQSAAPPACQLRHTFTLEQKPHAAWLLIRANRAQFRLHLNDMELARGAAYGAPQWVNLLPWLRVGANVIAIDGYNAAAGSLGIAGRMEIELTSGDTRVFNIDETWQAGTSVESKTIGSEQCFAAIQGHCAQDGRDAEPQEKPTPCPHLRREFLVDGPVLRARLYATSLGVYEPRLNGQQVGCDLLAPGWTDYNKRLQYQVYDVTDMLSPGQNVLGAILGDGWYTGSVGGFGRSRYGRYPLAFRAQLEIDFIDGQRLVISTDSSWRGSAGPILLSDLQMGEIYDARLEMPGWDVAGYREGHTSPLTAATASAVSYHTASSWRPIEVLPAPEVEIVPQIAPPVRMNDVIQPIAVSEPSPGVLIFDMGQNMVGTCQLRAKGPAGTTITLRFGEMLNLNGSLYTENLRTSRQVDVYILNGSPDGECFRPRFTFHGFRYVEVTGYPEEPDIEALTGLVLHSGCSRAGQFECSDPMVNQLYSNILWGQRGNFVSVPTDCPQRDERVGWTGDAQVFVRTACMNMDVATFFHTYMQAITDGQQPSGAIPNVAPLVTNHRYGSPAWGDACVIIPWTIYQVYGDTTILENHYDTMKRWVAYLQERSDNLIRPAEGFGDWLSVDADTPKEVLATAFFAYVTDLLAQIAGVLGSVDDAVTYGTLFELIRLSFMRAFVQPDGRIHGDTQTCYILGLKMNLLPPDLRSVAAKHLVRTVEEKNWHLSTGFVGVGYLLPVLTEMGYSDVAYRLLNNDTYPSWGYSIRQGATTIWERWNSYTKDTGFGNAGMNSFNHYSLGSVGEWMYRYVGGIELDPEYPGYRKFILRPTPGGRLTWAKVKYHSMAGRISSEWRLVDGRLHMEIEIPTNTSARVYVPIGENGIITESGVQIWPLSGLGQSAVAGLRSAQSVGNQVVFRLEGGSYSICSW